MPEGYSEPMPARRSGRRAPAPVRAALIAALALGLAAAGCGGASDAQQVRAALARYAKGTARQDYDGLCAKVIAQSLVHRLALVGLPCEQALRIGLRGVQSPQLKVLKVKVTGARALALVRTSAANQPASTDTIRLVKEGGAWRISSLSQAGPPAPAGRRPQAGD